MAGKLIGDEVASSKALTQVYTATHGGDGLRLPYMHRSFISFSFGGRNIEDFGLIAVTEGDRIQRQGSSEFEDITTTYEVINGQMYWGTYFKGNTLSLNLATDGITQRQLDDFLRWFRGGETRELILSEHPNRGIYARVAEPPALSLLPFENKTTLTIQYNTFTTSTTLYRGEIELTFQMDEPFWHAIENIFGHWDEEQQIYVDEWKDANGRMINIFDEKRNKDAIKIMLEDGIPFSSMIQDNMLLGNNTVANTSNAGGAIVGRDSIIMEFTRISNIPEDGEEEEETTVTFSAECYIIEYMQLIVDVENGTTSIIPSLQPTPKYRIIFGDNFQSFDDSYISYTGGSGFTFHNYDVMEDFSAIFGRDQMWEPMPDLSTAGIPDWVTKTVGNGYSTNDLVVYYDRVYKSLIDDNIATPSITVQEVKAIVTTRLGTDASYWTDQWDDPDSRTHVHENPEYATRIQGVYMTDSGGIEDLEAGLNAANKYYFYYAGTAPAYPILEFSLQPVFDINGYINSPANSFARAPSITENYNTFIVESREVQKFQFTTSNIHTSFNTAIQIFNNNQGKNAKDLYTAIQENVKHYLVRAWAVRILDYYVNNSRTIDSTIKTLMSYIFKNYTTVVSLPEESAHYSFDSKLGTAIGTFKIRDCTETDTIPESDSGWQSYCSTLTTITENVGDMVKSNWLVIKERNQPDDNNLIRAWDGSTETSKLYSHRIYHNVQNGMQHVKLIYNNMYV